MAMDPKSLQQHMRGGGMIVDDVETFHRSYWPYSQFEVNTTRCKYGRTPKPDTSIG